MIFQKLLIFACGTDEGLAHKSDCREGILSDAVDNNKPFLENLVRNNSECSRFFYVIFIFFLYNMYF